MDVNFHHTIATPSGGKGKPAGSPEGNGNGAFAQTLDGNFFDILFNRINAQNTEATEITGDGTEGESLAEGALTLDSATDPLSADSIDADALLDAVAGAGEGTGEITNPEILADGAARMEKAKLENMSAADLKQFKAALESLLQGIPAENRPSVMNISPGQLKKALENLNIDLSEIGTEDGALIAAGLDPAALAELQQKIIDGAESFMLNMAGKKEPAANSEDALLLSSAIIIPKGANQNIAGASGDGLDARGIMDAVKAALNGMKGDMPLHEYRANNILQSTGTNGEAAATPTAGNSTFPALNAPGLSNLFSSAAWDSVFPEGLDWAQGSNVHPALANSMQAASLTSLVSHAPQAGQPHPASQVVAATITKTAAGGENKNITVKLNPPELGRVEIRMEFSDDKKVKANIVIEKPETHLMLQRDSHMLERALQEAGLDVDGNALSFELAQDGSLFDQDGNDNSGSNDSGSSGGGAGDGTGEEIIEATMDWYVDPETGLTRYDILA